MSVSDDLLPDLVQALVAAVTAERHADIPGLLDQLPTPPRLAAGGRALLAKEQLRVFRRDRFTCRYCGKRTVFIPVLRALSSLFPDRLRYHPHWRWESTHPIYWTHGCSCDHLVPVSRGGTSAGTNLVTACYQCNSIKQHWLLDELRWELLPIETAAEWDGLSGYYPDLCKVAKLGWDRYHAAWIRAVQLAR